MKRKRVFGFFAMNNKRARAAMLRLLCFIVAFSMVIAMVQTGLTEEIDAACGKDEHTHSESCYGLLLICGLEECDDPFASETSLHSHDESCYETDWDDLICALEEHTHDESCYIQPPILFEPFGLTPGVAAAADLYNFVTGVTVSDSEGEDVDDGNFYYGETYTFNIFFAEDQTYTKDPAQLAYDGGRLYYELPSQLEVVSAVTAAEILLDNGKVCGWYDIDLDGSVRVWFDDVDNAGDPIDQNFIDRYENASFNLEIKAKFKEGAGAGTLDFSAGEKIIVVNIQEPPAGLRVVKTASTTKTQQDIGTESVAFTVVITAVGGPISNISLTDTMQVMEYNTTSPAYDVTSDYFSGVAFTYEIDGSGTWLSISPTWSGDVMTFDFSSVGVLEKNSKITLKYSMPLEAVFDDIAEVTGSDKIDMQRFDYDLWVRNDATASGKDSANNSVGDSDYSRTRMQNLFYSKSGTANIEDGVTKLHWEVEIGDGYKCLNGETVTDELGVDPPQTITGDILVTIYGHIKPGVTGSSSNNWPWIELKVPLDDCKDFFEAFNASAGFTFLIPADGSGNINDIIRDGPEGGSHPWTPGHPWAPYYSDDNLDWGDSIDDIYYVEFDYATESATTSANAVFSNGLASSLTDDGHIVKVGIGDLLTKASRWIFDDDGVKTGIEYIINVTIPAGNQGKRIYLRDYFYGGDYETGTVAATYLPEAPPTDLYSVSLIPDDDPLFTYSFVHYDSDGSTTPKDFHRYNHYFTGTGTLSTNSSTSLWPYSDDRVIQIKYTIPIDEIAIGNYTSIREFLCANPRNYIRNRAMLIIDDITVGDVSVLDDDCIVKEVFPTDDPRVFDYVVTFNPGARNQLFIPGGIAIFEDIFDPRMEYVEKSFYGYRRNSTGNWNGNGTLYGPYTAADSASTGVGLLISDPEIIENPLAIQVDNSAGTIWANFGAFRYCRGAYGPDGVTRLNSDIKNADLRGSVATETTWYANSTSAVEIHYQLRVKDEYALDDFWAENVAVISPNYGRFAGLSFSADAKTRYIPDVVSKDIMLINGNVVDVEIVINENGMDLVPDEPPGLDKTRFTATDTMTGDLAFFVSTIEIYTQTKTGDAWDGVWKKQTISTTAGELWSLNHTFDQTMEFILPNKTPVKIVYKALITVAVGEAATFDNTIEVQGFSSFFERDSFVVQTPSGGAFADDFPMKLLKADSETGELASGAEFELYAAIPGGGVPEGAIGGASAKSIVVGGMTFYHIRNAVELGSSGEYEFARIGLFCYGSGATFLAVETAAPEGYILPAEPANRTFFVLRTLSPSALSDLETLLDAPVRNSVADTFTVSNTPMTIPVSLGGVKHVTGAAAPAGTEFTFTLDQVDSDGSEFSGVHPLPGFPLEEKVTTTVTGPGDYIFSFVLPDLRIGTSWFLLAELDDRDEEDDWVYDETEYLIRVDVELVAVEGVDTLEVTVTYAVRGENGDFPSPDATTSWAAYPENGASFTNDYETETVRPMLPETGGAGVSGANMLSGTLLMLLSAAGALVFRRRKILVTRRKG